MYKNIALIVLGVLAGTVVFGFVMGIVVPYLCSEMMTLEEVYHILTTPAWQVHLQKEHFNACQKAYLFTCGNAYF
jgi:hypothetical protein